MQRYTLSDGRLRPGAGGGWGVWVLCWAELPRRRGGAAAGGRLCRAGAGPRPYRHLPGLHPGGGPAAGRRAPLPSAWASARCGWRPKPCCRWPGCRWPPCRPPRPGRCWPLLEQAAETAAPDLQRQEDCLDRLEEALGRGQLQDFGARALAVRRALAALHGGWAALARLAQDPAGRPPPRRLTRAERAAWDRFAARAASLRDEAETLREYTMQLWQVCHANIELRQTRVTHLADRCGHALSQSGPCHGLVRHEFPEYAGPGRALGLPGGGLRRRAAGAGRAVVLPPPRFAGGRA